ncbi:unnamed protein product [Didymodactylos carnosus]|uniref:Uncharacterized protein n=2 Tax=Didymodactylos carnosus TaxID=1234261 RepID=A0A8S2EG03_9BILA|nr:unnamed protein product [Didymodactylos carnosus]CAF4005708.1 unnamed protein product [Didymodactylos carnosus]
MDECLDEYIETAEDSIKMLSDLIDDINAHHDRCNAARAVGTTASVGGGLLTIACVCAAPFTGGTSLVGLTGVGMATGLAGAATNLGTEVVDMIWTKKYHDELLEIDRKRESVTSRLNMYLEQIEAKAAEIYEASGNEEEATKEALVFLITTGKIG